MHMMSKEDVSSDEKETLPRSRNPTTAVTANGEVQTNEEAQVDVHDLDLFVTVRIHDDTTAVLSLGKNCEEHGYTYEWASGQKPHLSKQGKNELCKTENVVQLVVSGLLHRHRRTRQEHLQVQQAKWRSGTRKLSHFTNNSKQKIKE